MKKKLFTGNFYTTVIFCMVCVCVFTSAMCQTTPPPEPEKEGPDTRTPLTVSVLNRLGKATEDISSGIKTIQLVLSERITLEREDMEQNVSREAGGRAKFEDVHIRDVIVIPAQVEGQAVAYIETDEEIILDVCFETSNDYTLPFSCRKEDVNGYFYLQVKAGSGSTSDGGEYGIIEYDGQEYIDYGEREYRVKYSDNPYLFIKLSQNDIDKLNSRTLPGRKVE